MKIITLQIFLISFFLFGCSEQADTESSKDMAEESVNTEQVEAMEEVGSEKITKLWETSDTELKTPESIIHDEKRDVLYVSNLNSGPMDKNETGFITKMSLEGEILELKWFSNPLWSPTGMAITGDHLFIADVNRVVEIDLETAALVAIHSDESGQFFNDVAADQKGNVYVSDMMTNTIHRIKDGKIETWLASDELNTPNGLTVADGKLIVGTWGVIDGEGFTTTVPGHLLSIALCNKKISDLGSAASIGNLDGVEQMANGDFLVTDWMNGKLFLIDGNAKVETLLDLDQGSADHEYIKESGLVLIPMMNSNKILGYRLNK